MNIVTYGARFYGGQIDRIDKGLRELGHRVNDFLGPPDLIYCNDMANSDNAFLKKATWPSAKLILNVLDVPLWVPDWKNIHDEWLGKLNGADKITCISQAVKKDIYNCFLIESDVIYNPIKPITRLNLPTEIPFLFVGRALAPNKRGLSILKPLQSLLTARDPSFKIHIVGSENPGFGIYHGVVDDAELNRLYNVSLFTLVPSLQEGLNLPMIEALCAGSIPIVAQDMSTSQEFCPPEFLCEPHAEAFFNKMFHDLPKLPESQVMDILEKYHVEYSVKFSPKSIASNIVSVYNSL